MPISVAFTLPELSHAVHASLMDMVRRTVVEAGPNTPLVPDSITVVCRLEDAGRPGEYRLGDPARPEHVQRSVTLVWESGEPSRMSVIPPEAEPG